MPFYCPEGKAVINFLEIVMMVSCLGFVIFYIYILTLSLSAWLSTL